VRENPWPPAIAAFITGQSFERETLQKSCIAFLLICVAMADVRIAGAQQLQLTPLPVAIRARNKVSPPAGGWYPWYQVAADPTDPEKLIVCGSKWDSQENALYGFVFSSLDGGQSWTMALEDKNSTWVSEQSCAFGVNGKAYFVSEAGNVIDGSPAPEQSTTRIFVSNDAGRTWTSAAKTSSADYSSSVVDTVPGPNQNRLYTFFNDAVSSSIDPPKEQSEPNGNRVGLISFKDGDKQVTGPIFNPKMRALGLQGSFPNPAFLLKDGSLLTLYLGGPTGAERTLGAVRTKGDRDELADPVIITSRKGFSEGENGEKACSGDAATYDPLQGQIYVAYQIDVRCHLMLTTSVDGGATWSRGQPILQPDTMGHGFQDPAMAFNRNGILGLMWRDEPSSDCWYFSASADRGKTFTPAHPLSQCVAGRSRSLTESNAFLRMAGTLWVPSDPSKPESPSGRVVPGLQVLDARDTVWRNDSLTATSDGVFHPVWIEVGSGEGQLRTAAVLVGASGETPLDPLRMREKGSRDISQEVAVLYGGDQHYDISSSTLTVEVVLKNKSSKPIQAPIFLKALTLDSKLGKLKIANASNGASGPGAIWDLSNAVPSEGLQPGATTAPCSLVFYIPNGPVPSWEVELVSMQLEVLASTTVVP
jgi:hypothetical protein